MAIRAGSALRDAATLAPAKTTLPGREFRDGRGERSAVEVGPQPLGDDELRIGRLPQQEIRQPLLTPRCG